MGGQLAPDAPAQPTASKVKPSPGGTAAPDPEQALLELTLPAASPPPGTPAAQAAAEALEAVALEEGYRAGSLMVGARPVPPPMLQAVAAARAGQELPATLLDTTAGEQLPVTPASVVHGLAASVPGQTAAALRAAGAAMKGQQMAKAEEAAQAAAATAAAQRDWERDAAACAGDPCAHSDDCGQGASTPAVGPCRHAKGDAAKELLPAHHYLSRTSLQPRHVPTLSPAAQAVSRLLQVQANGCAPEGLHTAGASAHCCCQHGVMAVLGKLQMCRWPVSTAWPPAWGCKASHAAGSAQ